MLTLGLFATAVGVAPRIRKPHNVNVVYVKLDNPVLCCDRWFVHNLLTTAAFQPPSRLGSPVHVLSDQPDLLTSSLVAATSAEWVARTIGVHDVRRHSSAALQFERVYVHNSLSNYKFEMRCMQRWQVISEFIEHLAGPEGRSRAKDYWVVADGDVPLVAPAAWLYSPRYDDALLYWPGALGVFSTRAIHSFANFTMQLYDPSARAHLADMMRRYGGTKPHSLVCPSAGMPNSCPTYNHSEFRSRFLLPPKVLVEVYMWTDMTLQILWVRRQICGDAGLARGRSGQAWLPCASDEGPPRPKLRVSWADDSKDSIGTLGRRPTHARCAEEGMTFGYKPDRRPFNCSCGPGHPATAASKCATTPRWVQSPPKSGNWKLDRAVIHACSFHYQGSEKHLTLSQLPACYPGRVSQIPHRSQRASGALASGEG